MNSILIAMFVFVCGLVFLLMHQISRLMQMQEDLREQLDDFHKCTFSRLNDINHNIDILHELLNEGTDTILKAIGSNNCDKTVRFFLQCLHCDIDAISSYLEIMKNTILDMNDKINKPIYGGEVNDTEEVDLIPEHWTIATPSYTEDENM